MSERLTEDARAIQAWEDDGGRPAPAEAAPAPPVVASETGERAQFGVLPAAPPVTTSTG